MQISCVKNNLKISSFVTGLSNNLASKSHNMNIEKLAKQAPKTNGMLKNKFLFNLYFLKISNNRKQDDFGANVELIS